MSKNVFQHGFYVEGLQSPRRVCESGVLYRAACEAHEGVTAKSELYLSVYTFPDSFLESVKATGRTAGYDGVCWGKFLWFDIDRAWNLPTAVSDTVRLYGWLRKLGVQGMQIWFSGSKGFHLGVPICAFGDAAVPSEQFAAQCKAVAMNIAEQAGVTIDTTVYDRVRLFRIPNSKHEKTGLYKIPVTHNELQASDEVSWLLERARNPRRLLLTTESTGDADNDDVTYCETTVCIEQACHLWREVTANLEVKEKDTDTSSHWPAQSQHFPASGNNYPRLRKATLDFILDGAAEGKRAVELFKTTTDCVRCGWSEDAIFSLLPDAAKRTGLDIYEIEKQIRDGIRAEKGETK